MVSTIHAGARVLQQRLIAGGTELGAETVHTGMVVVSGVAPAIRQCSYCPWDGAQAAVPLYWAMLEVDDPGTGGEKGAQSDLSVSGSGQCVRAVALDAVISH